MTDTSESHSLRGAVFTRKDLRSNIRDRNGRKVTVYRLHDRTLPASHLPPNFFAEHLDFGLVRTALAEALGCRRNVIDSELIAEIEKSLQTRAMLEWLAARDDAATGEALSLLGYPGAAENDWLALARLWVVVKPWYEQEKANQPRIDAARRTARAKTLTTPYAAGVALLFAQSRMRGGSKPLEDYARLYASERADLVSDIYDRIECDVLRSELASAVFDGVSSRRRPLALPVLGPSLDVERLIAVLQRIDGAGDISSELRRLRDDVALAARRDSEARLSRSIKDLEGALASAPHFVTFADRNSHSRPVNPPLNSSGAR